MSGYYAWVLCKGIMQGSGGMLLEQIAHPARQCVGCKRRELRARWDEGTRRFRLMAPDYFDC